MPRNHDFPGEQQIVLVTVRGPQAMRKRWTEAAHFARLSLNAFVREAVNAYIDQLDALDRFEDANQDADPNQRLDEFLDELWRVRRDKRA